jgi:hypothetical protein
MIYITTNRITGYSHSGSVGTFEYAFDNEGNKKYEKRSFGSKGDAFRYDEIYRLTGVKYGVPNTDFNPATNYADYTTYDSKEEFKLDGVGNRIEVGNGTVSTTYTANTLNQYEQAGTANFAYDLNGNLKWDSVITCTYNYANQLIKVIRSSDLQVLGEYKYDCLGRRIWKKAWSDDTESFTETCFYYDGIRCIEC